VSREEMMRTARMLVEHCVALRPGENVLVIGDTETTPIAEVLAEAARASGGEVVTAIMTPRAQHGNDPPPTLAAAMQAADVMLMAVTHSITHTTARKEASARGARAAILRSVTVESMTQGAATADYPAVRNFQDGIGVVPLSHYGKPYAPPKGRVDDFASALGVNDAPLAVRFEGRLDPRFFVWGEREGVAVDCLDDVAASGQFTHFQRKILAVPVHNSGCVSRVIHI